MDAKVTRFDSDTRHHVMKLANGGEKTCVLNEFNHSGQSFENVDKYSQNSQLWCQQVAQEYTYVNDAITNNKLKVGEQLICIDMQGN